MASVSYKLISCEGCSSLHHPAHTVVYEHNVSAKKMSFCGDRCAMTNLGIPKQTSGGNAAASAAAPATQQQMGAGRGERLALTSSASAAAAADELAGFDEVEKTLAIAQRDADRAMESGASDASDSDASSGFDSDSSAGSSDGGSRRRRNRRTSSGQKRSKKSRAAKALKKSLLSTLNAMLKVTAKLLTMAEQNLSVENIKAGLKIISKGVSLAMKIIPVLLPLLPLLILARRGENQSVPAYLKAELANLMRMIQSIIAGVKSARLTRDDLTSLKTITQGVIREFSQFIGQQRAAYGKPKQQQQQLMGRPEVRTEDLVVSR